MMNNQHKKIEAKRIWLLYLLMILLTISTTACSPSATSPGVKITSSLTGEADGDVTISADMINFELLSESENTNESGKGHIIFYKDVSVPIYYEHSAISKAGTYSIEYKNSFTWNNVTPGKHTFSVQLVNSRDMPLPSAAVDSITIDVPAPKGSPDIQIITPADGSSLSPGNIKIRIIASNFIISRENMGVMNQKGAGHLIYYIDESPPITPGEPAMTDTSVVSISTEHLWKSLQEGSHTLSVQLVNNDDTPLDIPVVRTISVDLQP